MKKIFVLLLIFGCSLTGFAQNTFTKETLKEILDEYKKDSKAFFNNRLTDDFRNTTQQGTYRYKAEVVAWGTQNIASTEILEPVIYASGDLAVVSGIHQTTRIGKDNSKTTGQVAATYTFHRVNGKWMFAATHQSDIVEPK